MIRITTGDLEDPRVLDFLNAHRGSLTRNTPIVAARQSRRGTHP